VNKGGLKGGSNVAASWLLFGSMAPPATHLRISYPEGFLLLVVVLPVLVALLHHNTPPPHVLVRRNYANPRQARPLQTKLHINLHPIPRCNQVPPLPLLNRQTSRRQSSRARVHHRTTQHVRSHPHTTTPLRNAPRLIPHCPAHVPRKHGPQKFMLHRLHKLPSISIPPNRHRQLPVVANAPVQVRRRGRRRRRSYHNWGTHTSEPDAGVTRRALV